MTDRVRIYMCFHTASMESTAGNKSRLFSSRFLILGEAFRNDHVAAGSFSLRSATEKNKMGGYVTVPCSFKMTQRSSTADWFKF